MLLSAGVYVCFFTVAMCTHERDVTMQHYPNLNHKKGTKCRPRNPNPRIAAETRPKGRRVVATIVGLWFLDAAVCLSQHSEDAST